MKALLALLLSTTIASADVAVVCNSAIWRTFPQVPPEVLLPSGDIVEANAVGWVVEGCKLSSVVPFVPLSGQQIVGSVSSSLSGGVVSQVFSTQPIPPPLSAQVVSLSSPALNAPYLIDPFTQQRMGYVTVYVIANNRFPAGNALWPWQDANGTTHLFSTITWKNFATALTDFIIATALSQTTVQPITIP